MSACVEAFSSAVSTSGGTVKGNWELRAVLLLASADRRAAKHSALLLPVLVRPSADTCSHGENILGSTAAAFGLHTYTHHILTLAHSSMTNHHGFPI